MSKRERADLLAAIESHLRSAHAPDTPPAVIERSLGFELASLEIHRANLVPFVRGHGAGPSTRILDFGSGPGCSACAMALDLGAHVVGVEVARKNERVAALWAEWAGVTDRVSFHFVGETRALPFGDGTFELAVASSVLEYIPGDRRPYLGELWRVLAPGGRLLVAGTSNAAWPREVHSKTWTMNWMPNLGPRLRAWRGQDPRVERGVTFGELEASLPGARFVRGQSRELEAFASRVAERFVPDAARGLRAGVTMALEGALQRVDRATSRAIGWPAEAFLPWLNVAFEKPL